jgi:Mrp family chromosome partitioning ATPase
MRELAARLRDEADVVLYDSPPVMAVTDATVLAKQVDATLLVVDSASRRGMVQQATAVLRQVGAKVAGVVLNKVSASRGGYYYYYYSRYYRYGDDGKGERRRRRRDGGLRRAWGRLRRWLEQ